MAAQGSGGMSGNDPGRTGAGRAGSAFAGAMDAVMRAVDVTEAADDPDIDCLPMSTPHRRSAVDMARGPPAQGDRAGPAALPQTVTEARETEAAAVGVRVGHPMRWP